MALLLNVEEERPKRWWRRKKKIWIVIETWEEDFVINERERGKRCENGSAIVDWVIEKDLKIGRKNSILIK